MSCRSFAPADFVAREGGAACGEGCSGEGCGSSLCSGDDKPPRCARIQPACCEPKSDPAQTFRALCPACHPNDPMATSILRQRLPYASAAPPADGGPQPHAKRSPGVGARPLALNVRTPQRASDSSALSKTPQGAASDRGAGPAELVEHCSHL